MSQASAKSFSSSVISAENPAPAGQQLMYVIDDREVYFVAPDVNQLAMMVSMIERASDDLQASALIISIFFSLIDDDPVDDDDLDEDEVDTRRNYTRGWLESRMMDRRDDFGLGVITAVMNQMMEDWSSRPTQRSSRSSSSPSSRGTTSKATPRGRASTSGGSPSRNGARR